MTWKRSSHRWAAVAACGLSFALLGCPEGANPDGGLLNPGNQSGGGANRPDSSDRPALVRPPSTTLFVADPTIGVMSFAGANTLDGNVVPTTFIDSFQRLARSNDQFAMTARAVCVDRTGTLIVHDAAPALRFYDGAATVTGIPAPDRLIEGLATRLADGSGLAYDRENDRLFVATSDRVVIFEGQTLARTGGVAPTRVFSNVELGIGESIALGPNGDLYVSDGSQSILVFANAGSRSGEIPADRTILLSFFLSDRIFVDSRDRLYVADGDEIAVLDDASMLDGVFETFPLMRLQGVRAIDEEGSSQPEIESIAVDSRGIGYVADRANAAIHVIDAIGAQRGDVRTNRAIHGPGVVFDRPFSIFLWE